VSKSATYYADGEFRVRMKRVWVEEASLALRAPGCAGIHGLGAKVRQYIRDLARLRVGRPATTINGVSRARARAAAMDVLPPRNLTPNTGQLAQAKSAVKRKVSTRTGQNTSK
jgi:hypothetical protein